MSVRNVGIVFSPTLNIPAPILTAFLQEFEAIFSTPPPPDARIPALTNQRHQAQNSASSLQDESQVQSQQHSRARSNTPDSKRSDSRPRNSRKASREDVPVNNNMMNLHSSYDIHSAGTTRQLHSAQAASSQPTLSTMPLPPRPTQGPPPSSLNSQQQRSQRESTAPGLGATSMMRDVKARRRESSMMLMNMGPALGSHGQQVIQMSQGGMMGSGGGGAGAGAGPGGRPVAGERKSSMPSLRNPVGE